MTALKDYPRPILEVYAAHLVLHVGCKVPLEDLYVTKAIAPDGTGEGVGVLAKQENFEFVLTCGPFGMPKDDFKRLWLEVVPLINKASVAERDEATENTWARANSVKIIAAFLAKRELSKRKKEQN